MKTQAELNEEWRMKSGDITMLVSPRRDSGLRKPYDYEMNAQSVTEMVQELRSLIKACPQLQCRLFTTASLAFGKKLHIYVVR